MTQNIFFVEICSTALVWLTFDIMRGAFNEVTGPMVQGLRLRFPVIQQMKKFPAVSIYLTALPET
jgi:hypothetical protein